MHQRFTLFGLALPAVLAAGLVLTLGGCSSQAEAPVMPQALGDQCVEPTDVMRRNHMAILFHERDEAKRYGRRNADHSFVGCIDCHVSPSASRDQPETHFCMACHQFNAVKMDCFQCHTDKPSDEAADLWEAHGDAAALDATIDRHLAGFTGAAQPFPVTPSPATPFPALPLPENTTP